MGREVDGRDRSRGATPFGKGEQGARTAGQRSRQARRTHPEPAPRTPARPRAAEPASHLRASRGSARLSIQEEQGTPGTETETTTPRRRCGRVAHQGPMREKGGRALRNESLGAPAHWLGCGGVGAGLQGERPYHWLGL